MNNETTIAERTSGGRDASEHDGPARPGPMHLRLATTPSGAGPQMTVEVLRHVACVQASSTSRASWMLKRTLDVGAACFILLALAPALAVITMVIRCDSDGPVLFRQRRVGRDGRVFTILKFRTMVDHAHGLRSALADQHGVRGLFKLDSDPRATRFGRVLRRTSLDELPQLVNVLRGEMSLVGPRPLVPEEDGLIQGHLRRRLDVRPGMTGPWQVTGPERPKLAEMAELDIRYVANWSLVTDAGVVLRTIAHVITCRGQ